MGARVAQTAERCVSVKVICEVFITAKIKKWRPGSVTNVRGVAFDIFHVLQSVILESNGSKRSKETERIAPYSFTVRGVSTDILALLFSFQLLQDMLRLSANIEARISRRSRLTLTGSESRGLMPSCM